VSRRTRAAAEPRSGTRRDQLAAIAAELFARHGYHNVSVSDIAAVAGVSGPALYRHFRSKQAVLGHVMRAGLAEAVRVSDEQSGTGTDQRLRSIYAGLAAFMVRQPEFGVLWRRERRHLAAEDAAAMRQQIGHVSSVVVGELRRLRSDMSSADASMLSWAALSVVGSISDHRVRLPQAAFERLLTAIAMDVLAAALRSTPDHAGHREPAAELPALDSRREQLLAAAARLFWDRGYHAVTMEEIGAAAGIAGPSIYGHFAGKSELLQTAANRIAARLRQSTEETSGAGLGERETLELLIASYVDMVLDNRDLLAAYFTEGHNLPEHDRVEFRRFQGTYAGYWADLAGAVLPDCAEKEVRIRVHAAFAVVNDLARTRRFSPHPDFAAQLRTLMRTVLLPPP
jgi:AcrR family transcriptional regulator